MDFRKKLCIWCIHRTEDFGICRPCPKYQRYGLNRESELTMQAFCSICANRDDNGLIKFCATNRFMQEDSGEDFECYKFCLSKGIRYGV